MYNIKWCLGAGVSAVFSLAYVVAPIYSILSVLLFFFLPLFYALLFAVPAILSFVVPPLHAPTFVGTLTPILDYFHYHESFDEDNDMIRERIKSGRRFIIASQPHGVISFVGICAAINAPPDMRQIKTAVPFSVMNTPILKHVMGIFGLLNASRHALHEHFKKSGLQGCVILYVGDDVEISSSSPSDERLHLSRRKGFIKMALRENMDIIPTYLFGNTSVFSIFKYGPLALLSRFKYGPFALLPSSIVPFTCFWGKWYMPIPRNETLLYARGKPLGLPHIPEPTDADVDKWHAKYCEALLRLFDSNKEKLPNYKHKKLLID